MVASPFLALAAFGILLLVAHGAPLRLGTVTGPSPEIERISTRAPNPGNAAALPVIQDVTNSQSSTITASEVPELSAVPTVLSLKPFSIAAEHDVSSETQFTPELEPFMPYYEALEHSNVEFTSDELDSVPNIMP